MVNGKYFPAKGVKNAIHWFGTRAYPLSVETLSPVAVKCEALYHYLISVTLGEWLKKKI